MDEFDRRMRDLDGIDADVDWQTVEHRKPRTEDLRGGPSTGKRILVGSVAFAVFLGTAGVLGWQLRGSEPTNAPSPIVGAGQVSPTSGPEEGECLGPLPPLAPGVGVQADLDAEASGTMLVPTFDEGPFGRIFEVQLPSLASRDLTAELGLPDLAPQLAPSPDGTLIALQVADGDRTRETHVVNGSEMDGEIWTMEPDGSNRIRLTENETQDGDVGWTPDGSLITFTSNRDGDVALYAMQPDGSDVQRLTPEGLSFINGYDWSPDGTRIVFSASEGVGSQVGESLRTLIEDRGVNMNDSECVEALAKSIRGSDIYVMGADGSNLTRLTDSDQSYMDPSWSPDGQRIVFDIADPEREFSKDIALMNADGSDIVRLTEGGPTDTSPEWSPSGALIVFSSGAYREVAGESVFDDALYLIHPDGSGRVELLSPRELGMPEGSYIGNQDWLP